MNFVEEEVHQCMIFIQSWTSHYSLATGSILIDVFCILVKAFSVINIGQIFNQIFAQIFTQWLTKYLAKYSTKYFLMSTLASPSMPWEIDNKLTCTKSLKRTTWANNIFHELYNWKNCQIWIDYQKAPGLLGWCKFAKYSH